MAYDEHLVDRIRTIVVGRRNVSEKKMFGGLCFLLNGNMLCVVAKDKLMLRVGTIQYDELLEQPGVSEMDFTGKSMRGFIYVDESVCYNDKLNDWLDKAERFVGALPIK